jgi:hypothetical protein
MTQFDTAILQHLVNTNYCDVNQQLTAVCSIDNVDYYVVKMTAYPSSKACAFYISTDKKAKKNNILGQFFVDFDDSGIITDVKQCYVY